MAFLKYISKFTYQLDRKSKNRIEKIKIKKYNKKFF